MSQPNAIRFQIGIKFVELLCKYYMLKAHICLRLNASASPCKSHSKSYFQEIYDDKFLFVSCIPNVFRICEIRAKNPTHIFLSLDYGQDREIAIFIGNQLKLQQQIKR